MANNVSTYIGYFRQLAVSHKDLRHDPLSEQGLGQTKDCKFGTFGNQEVIQGLRKTIGEKALMLELYDEYGNGENAFDIRIKPKGAFMVVAIATENDFIDEERAYAETESIVYDILRKIYQDHAPGSDECARPFREFKFSYEKTATGKVFSNYYGWYVQFDFEFKKTVDITKAPDAGTFI